MKYLYIALIFIFFSCKKDSTESHIDSNKTYIEVNGVKHTCNVYFVAKDVSSDWYEMVLDSAGTVIATNYGGTPNYYSIDIQWLGLSTGVKNNGMEWTNYFVLPNASITGTNNLFNIISISDSTISGNYSGTFDFGNGHIDNVNGEFFKVKLLN